MKAVVYHNYGSPDVLECAEIEKPATGDDEVLIKVRAASVNPLDCRSSCWSVDLTSASSPQNAPAVTLCEPETGPMPVVIKEGGSGCLERSN